MKNLIFIIFTFFVIVSCKKDRLNDEKSILIGKWEWVYADHYYDVCEGAAIYETLTPESENVTFQFEFQKKGIFIFRKNNELVSTYKTKFEDFGLTQNNSFIGWYYFEILLNNDKDLYPFRGKLDGDSLITSGFEGFGINEQVLAGCEGYSYIFIKQ
jgi:hypothetical protein